MKEYREIYHSGPIRLYKNDLFELQEILHGIANWEFKHFKINATFGDLNITADSLESLLKNRMPVSTDTMSFELFGRDETGDNEGGIDIRFCHNYVHYQLYSSDEGWYLATKRKIDKFLSLKRPWFWPLKKTIGYSFLAILSTLMFCGAAGLFIIAFKRGHNNYYILGASCFLISLIGFAFFKESLFPYVQIFFSDKRQINYQLLTLLIMLLTLIITILGTIVIPFLISK